MPTEKASGHYALQISGFHKLLLDAIRKQQPFKVTVKSVIETLLEEKATALSIDIRKLSEEYRDDDEAIS